MILLAQLKASPGLTVDKSLHNDNLVWCSLSPLDLSLEDNMKFIFIS